MSDASASPATPSEADDFDRHSRRVLWSLPSGLYLVGSRHGEAVNLMTANLVVQVCLEPKLVAVALEVHSVTAGLVLEEHAFSISILARADRDVVRRFVKPVPPESVERNTDANAMVTAMAGHAVSEVGPHRLPILSVAVGHLVCDLTASHPLGSHTLCIGQVVDVGGEPTEVLRMEDTRMHYGG
jgi:flavin reductase (DIM6/NTAB) family NADH-FMN oxidoreductase RutF